VTRCAAPQRYPAGALFSGFGLSERPARYRWGAAQRVTCRSYKDVRVELAPRHPWGAGYASYDVGFGLARPSHRSPPSRGAEDGNRSSVTGTLADLHDRTTISESYSSDHFPA